MSGSHSWVLAARSPSWGWLGVSQLGVFQLGSLGRGLPVGVGWGSPTWGLWVGVSQLGVSQLGVSMGVSQLGISGSGSPSWGSPSWVFSSRGRLGVSQLGISGLGSPSWGSLVFGSLGQGRPVGGLWVGVGWGLWVGVSQLGVLQ